MFQCDKHTVRCILGSVSSNSHNSMFPTSRIICFDYGLKGLIDRFCRRSCWRACRSGWFSIFWINSRTLVLCACFTTGCGSTGILKSMSVSFTIIGSWFSSWTTMDFFLRLKVLRGWKVKSQTSNQGNTTCSTNQLNKSNKSGTGPSVPCKSTAGEVKELANGLFTKYFFINVERVSFMIYLTIVLYCSCVNNKSPSSIEDARLRPIRLRTIRLRPTGRSRNWPKSNRRCLLCFFFLSFLFFLLLCLFTFLYFFLVLAHLSLHFVVVLFLFSSRKTWTEPETPNPAPHCRWTLPLDNPPPDNPPPDNPPPDRPKFRSFFPPPATIFILHSLSWSPFVEFWWCFRRPEPSNMHVWALWLSCETPAAPPDRAAGARTRQPENSKRAHFTAPALQTPPKFHERTPRERKKKENCGGKREKKTRNFGLPTLSGLHPSGLHPSGPPPFGAPTLWGPHLRGPTFSGFGPPPFGASTLRGLHPSGPHPSGPQPSGPQPSGPTFAGFGPPPSGPPPFGGPTLCGPKIQHPKMGRSRNWPKSKLAEVKIGRSQNWPKSKLAEVEKKSWPKSKLAEVDRARSIMSLLNIETLAVFRWACLNFLCINKSPCSIWRTEFFVNRINIDVIRSPWSITNWILSWLGWLEKLGLSNNFWLSKSFPFWLLNNFRTQFLCSFVT